MDNIPPKPWINSWSQVVSVDQIRYAIFQRCKRDLNRRETSSIRGKLVNLIDAKKNWIKNMYSKLYHKIN